MLDIPGIDVKHGIAMTGGTEEGYCKVLDIFRRDAAERLRMCRFFLFGDGNISDTFPEKHLNSLITQIQALKSASATIGAKELSEQATRIETAGKEKDFVFIQSNLLVLVEQLSELTQNIKTALEEGKSEENAVSSIPDSSGHNFSGDLIPDLLNELAAALKSKNVVEIDRMLDKLIEAPLDQNTKETIKKIYDQVLMTEFESAIKTINEYVNTSAKGKE